MTEIAETLGKGFSQSNKQAMRNPWVWGWLALVAVVLAVNIGMVSLAFITNPGLVSTDYYDKGRALEKSIATRQAARTALGWDLSLEIPATLVVSRPDQFNLVVTDKIGNPLSDATVHVFAYRPADAAVDFNVQLDGLGNGLYRGAVGFPLKGIWDLIVEVRKGEDRYQIARRVSVLGS